MNTCPRCGVTYEPTFPGRHTCGEAHAKQTPATPTADVHTCYEGHCEPTAPEADVHSCYEGHCTPTYAELRDAAAEKDFNDNCDVHSEDADTHFKGFKAGADWGYAKGRAERTASTTSGHLSMDGIRKLLADPIFGDGRGLTMRYEQECIEKKKEIDRLRLELAEYKAELKNADEDLGNAHAREDKLTAELNEYIEVTNQRNALLIERDELRARLERADSLAEMRKAHIDVLAKDGDHALAALEYAKRAIEHEDLSFPHAEESVLAEIERILGES